MKTKLILPSYRPFVEQPGPCLALPEPFLQGTDLSNLRKCGKGLRSWIKIDKDGSSRVMEVDKLTVMRRCDLPARDLRLLDPVFEYPSTILGREKAMVVNLEQIKCIITADEVLLLHSLHSNVQYYVAKLQKRLTKKGDFSECLPTDERYYQEDDRIVLQHNNTNTKNRHDLDHHHQVIMGERHSLRGSSSADYMPFEFLALEVALEATCTFLDNQATKLDLEARPILNGLTSKINMKYVEHLRQLKSKLLALTSRVQKVRDEIEKLIDDDGDMAEMYLTEKKWKQENFNYKDQATSIHSRISIGGSISTPISPICSPSASPRLEKTFSMAMSHRSNSTISDEDNDVQELEMLLEAYFVAIDSTLNKLTSLKQDIDNIEDFIKIQQDNVRNQVMKIDLLLSVAMLIVAILGVVAGIFGMNIPISIYNQPKAFKWVLIISGIVGSLIFIAFSRYFKMRGLTNM